jgi:hypothetical protein
MPTKHSVIVKLFLVLVPVFIFGCFALGLLAWKWTGRFYVPDSFLESNEMKGLSERYFTPMWRIKLFKTLFSARFPNHRPLPLIKGDLVAFKYPYKREIRFARILTIDKDGWYDAKILNQDETVSFGRIQLDWVIAVD